MDSGLAWLARCHKEGISGLGNRLKGGRPSETPGEVAAVKVRRKLKERNGRRPHSR